MTPKQWCKDNRQWRRDLNIAHAKLMLVQGGEDKFWLSVLDLLGAYNG